MIRDIILKIISWIYFVVIFIRHKLFDWKVLKSHSFSIPVICVGNITVGGTGKTPMSEMLIEQMQQRGYSVALLSRGYGRRTRGYREVGVDDESHSVGDEPLQMKRKFPNTLIVVCERRVVGIERIMELHPDIDMIIMDDGFQHRYVTPRANVIMMDATRPVYKDKPLPAGELRDIPASLSRANYFVITKCPEDMREEQRQEIIRQIAPREDQNLYFSEIETLAPRAIYADYASGFNPQQPVVSMAGVGNPDPFLEGIKSRYNVVGELLYSDHHEYTDADFEEIKSALQSNRHSVIITTEKDAIKFAANSNMPTLIKERIYYTPIKLKFEEGMKSQLLTNLENDIRTN